MKINNDILKEILFYANYYLNAIDKAPHVKKLIDLNDQQKQIYLSQIISLIEYFLLTNRKSNN